jgi:hypothetical protein
MKTVSFNPAPATLTELTACQAKDATSTFTTVSFNPAPATMTELTACQAKDATSTSRQSASIQLQPPLQNLLPVKPRMPQAHQDCQLHSSSSHNDRTYMLSSHGCHQHIKTVNFNAAPVTTVRWLTHCPARNMPHIKTISFIPPSATIQKLTSFQIRNTITVSNNPSNTHFVSMERSRCTVSALCHLSYFFTTHYLQINGLPSCKEYQCLLPLKIDVVTHH